MKTIRTRVEGLEQRARGGNTNGLPGVVVLDSLPMDGWGDVEIQAELRRLYPHAPADWLPAVVVPKVLDEAEWTRQVREGEARRHESR